MCSLSPGVARADDRSHPPAPVTAAPAVLLLNATDRVALALLLARYGMQLTLVAPGEGIPGSYWGHSEAGLKADRLYARPDTPVHSVLHEASHYVCMTPERRAGGRPAPCEACRLLHPHRDARMQIATKNPRRTAVNVWRCPAPRGRRDEPARR